MKTYGKLLGTSLLALSCYYSAPVLANINNVHAGSGFAYRTRQLVTIDIQVNTANHSPTGLAFYSAGVNGGLRLLDSQIVDGSGHYTGKLLVPAHLKSLIVKSRWLDNFKEVKLGITDHQLSAVIDH